MSQIPFAPDGWDQLSIWGYDEMADTYFAQLTRNGGDDSNEPEIWLSGVPTPIGTEHELAAMISGAVGADVRTVTRAMHDWGMPAR